MKIKNNYIKLACIIVLIMILSLGGFFLYNKFSNNTNSVTESNQDKPKSTPAIDKKTISPLLYEVTKEGSNNKIYLFGSIHAASLDNINFPEYVLKAYDDSHYLACEFDIIAYQSDQEKMVEDAMKMLYDDGTTIKDHLSKEYF